MPCILIELIQIRDQGPNIPLSLTVVKTVSDEGQTTSSRASLLPVGDVLLSHLFQSSRWKSSFRTQTLLRAVATKLAGGCSPPISRRAAAWGVQVFVPLGRRRSCGRVNDMFAVLT